MASFDEADYLKIDPAEIRLRITSDNDAPLIVDGTRLNIAGETENGAQVPLKGALLLESEEQLHPQESFLGWGYEPRHLWILKLDDAGIASFRTLQDLRRKHVIRRVSVQTHYDFKGREEAKIIVDLRLSAQDGYFTLLDKAKFPPDELRGASDVPSGMP